VRVHGPHLYKLGGLACWRCRVEVVYGVHRCTDCYRIAYANRTNDVNDRSRAQAKRRRRKRKVLG
jgi:hypothetical protein